MGSGWSENGDSECVCTQNGARLKLYLLFANTFAPGERILPIHNRFALITGNERQPLAVSLRHEYVCVCLRDDERRDCKVLCHSMQSTAE